MNKLQSLLQQISIVIAKEQATSFGATQSLLSTV
jgi:hypothetical protein